MLHTLIGKHDSIEKTRKLVDMVADTGFNVLITGETGTGKEVVARLLHARSPRAKKRFVKVNCGALPGTLLESELFGYEKGAFTGADHRKPGKFELAAGGLIFLDEIGEMPSELQAKLLEVLQSSSFHRLGGTREVKAKAWVVASTNRTLEQDVQKGVFREDLYYRLNVIKIELVPLRERREDLPLLIDHFMEHYRNLYGLENSSPQPGELEPLFSSYPWPGNVRELANVVLRLMVGETAEELREDILKTWTNEGTDCSSASNPKTDLQFNPVPLKTLKAEAEKAIESRAIRYALRASMGNKRRAARLLGISYKTLYNKLDNLGMSPGGEKNRGGP